MALSAAEHEHIDIHKTPVYNSAKEIYGTGTITKHQKPWAPGDVIN